MNQELRPLLLLWKNRFSAWDPHGGSQTPVTPVPETLMPSSAPTSRSTRHEFGVYTCMQANTHTHKIKQINVLKRKKKTDFFFEGRALI